MPGDPSSNALLAKCWLRAYGKSALCLSGGAGMGQYQLGVCKAMLEEGILPEVVSGSSAGALVAAHVCCRTPQELLGPDGTLQAT